MFGINSKKIRMAAIWLVFLFCVGAVVYGAWDRRGRTFDAWETLRAGEEDEVPAVDIGRYGVRPGSDVLFWRDTRRESMWDDVVVDCALARLNFGSYPTRVFGDMRRFRGEGYDYLILDSGDYEMLRLFLTFYDMDGDFAELAKDKEFVVMKRIRQNE